MKVLCVQKAIPEQDNPIVIEASKQLQVGSIYTVIDEMETHYELEEFQHFIFGLWFEKTAFAPLTGVDESELVNQQLQTV